MVMASSELMPEPESPLDVLSRAASMVESGASESESEVSPPRQEARLVHPKFRKHSASPRTSCDRNHRSNLGLIPLWVLQGGQEM